MPDTHYITTCPMVDMIDGVKKVEQQTNNTRADLVQKSSAYKGAIMFSQ